MNGYRQNTSRINLAVIYFQGGVSFLQMVTGFRYGNIGPVICYVTYLPRRGYRPSKFYRYNPENKQVLQLAHLSSV